MTAGSQAGTGTPAMPCSGCDPGWSPGLSEPAASSAKGNREAGVTRGVLRGAQHRVLSTPWSPCSCPPADREEPWAARQRGAHLVCPQQAGVAWHPSRACPHLPPASLGAHGDWHGLPQRVAQQGWCLRTWPQGWVW